MTIISIRVNVVKIHPDGDFFIVTLIFCPDSDCFPLMQGMCLGAKENHVKQDGRDVRKDGGYVTGTRSYMYIGLIQNQ